MTQTPSIGRIVHYTLSDQDATEINRRRSDYRRAQATESGIAKHGTGEQVHVGNPVEAGQALPAIIVQVWDNPYAGVQLQVFLDGNDTFWAKSVTEGDGQRHWQWPPRV